MALSRAMRRLVHVLEMQEERCLAEMEAALADLRRLEGALTSAGEQDCKGRRLVTASAAMGEVADRVAGLEETRVAQRRAQALRPRIPEAQATANARQGEFFSKRVERRQTQSMAEKMDATEATEAGRRGQREIDDWFLGKLGNRH